MTRQDAVKLATAGYGALGNYGTPAQAFVDMAVALGLLKLDKPKSAEDALWDALSDVPLVARSDVRIREVLRQSNLKIVEA